MPQWQSDGDPLSMLIQTILSQNTSDANSGRAFRSLRLAFPEWESLIDADVDLVAAGIKQGGLNRIKARRIGEVLRLIRERHGQLDLAFLSKMRIAQAEEWLLGLPGVGLKTARCVLLFSLCMPALPVDTHILRVSRRLGLLNSKASAEEAHRRLAEVVAPEDVYQFHVLMIEHGRKACHPRRPACMGCALRDICPSCGQAA